MMKKYYDANGIEYQIGDIVLNTSFGDFWVVQSVTNEDKEMYDLEDELCLALNNDKNDYVLDISVPQGFIVYRRLGKFEYDKLMEYISKVCK